MDLTDHAREFMAIILKNARRVNRLTEDLLALAQVESGEHKPACSRFASTLVDDAIELLAGMVVESGVALEPGETTDTLVLADVDAMTQVFGNLIENAMKYGASGRRVVVGARALEDAVEFYVQDFGTAWPKNISTASSSASIASTKPALANPAHRPRPRHRQAHRPRPRRHDSRRKRTRRRRDLPLHLPLAPIAQPPGSRQRRIADKGRSISSTRSS